MQDRQLEYTLATHAIERLRPSPEALALCARVAEGGLSPEQAVEAILARHGLAEDRDHD